MERIDLLTLDIGKLLNQYTDEEVTIDSKLG
jgi:hypothetical protein